MKKLPPWFPLAAFVVGAFLVIIVVWTVVIILARQHPMQPIERPELHSTPATPETHQPEPESQVLP